MMSGIFGVLMKEGSRKVGKGDVEKMSLSLANTTTGQISNTICGSVGLGANSTSGTLCGIVQKKINNSLVAMAFCGELFNLNEEGVAFQQEGSSPLQMLTSLYLQEGMEFLKRLRGEFAIIVWDGRTGTFHAATDRFRVYPLYYYQDKNILIVSSRLEAIFSNSFYVKRDINPEGIIDFMAFSAIPTPKTIYRNIYKLPPGYVLSCKQSDPLKLMCYWDVYFPDSNYKTKRELTQELKHSLLDAVTVLLNYDGHHERLGTFLSGGVDSSTLTGLIMQLADCRIKSFSIGFNEEQYNEMSYARIAARASGSELQEYFVTPEDVRDAIPLLLEAFDEPFGNASAIPTYYCAKLANQHGINTLYAGDGGDELFAGNERYAAQRVFEYYQAIPVWAQKTLVEPTVFFLSDSLKWPLLEKGRKYIRRANIPYPDRLWSYGFYSLHKMTDLFEDSVLEAIAKDYNPYLPMAQHYSSAQANTELDRQLYVDLKLSISDNDLLKVTRMAGAAGVRVRFPFLDHQLVEFSATIPAKFKMVRGKLRHFFKQAYKDLLPPEVLSKTKHGFGLPIPVWLKTDKYLNEMMLDLVLSQRSLSRDYFQKKALTTITDSHKIDTTSFYGTMLWNMMILELWHRKYVDSSLSI